jgi:hypothetical protein
MVERSRLPTAASGLLRFGSRGDCSLEDLREMLRVLDASYHAVARVELAAFEVAAALQAFDDYGPRALWRATLSGGEVPSVLPSVIAADRLIVHRVVLRSPGFWEVFGSLNPLEVVRKFLNDHHERRKDRDYREGAERRRLEIENALGELEVVGEIARLEERYGSRVVPSGIRRRVWAAEVRESFDQLADFEERGMIDGGSAQSGQELPELEDDLSN